MISKVTRLHLENFAMNFNFDRNFCFKTKFKKKEEESRLTYSFSLNEINKLIEQRKIANELCMSSM